MIDTPRYVLAAQPEARLVRTGVLVIGAGAAGLAAALAAAERAEVLVLARTSLPESNSAWAQGGIAAALDAADSPGDHLADTLVAGAGICDEAAVAALAAEAPALMRELAAAGVPFERADAERFALGLEGGHSRRRIVHVGDATGWAVTRTLIERARRHPRITLLEGCQAADLLSSGGQVCGALVRGAGGGWLRILAGATVLASGGAGALYGLSSNQPVALGEGIAMAYRAGAELADMEFVQFHPTVYRTRAGQGFLITEAARGEGGLLLSPAGERFMPAYDRRAELAPRDVVTRGIYAAMRAAGSDHVLLDLTHLGRKRVEHHFPTICERLRAEGLDPVVERIPVAPASHYLMGGVRSDLRGATSLPGLYVAGEAGCTGVHGANRLASNSLLECLVFGRRAGRAAAQEAKSRGQSAGTRWQTADGGRRTVTPGSAEPSSTAAYRPTVQTGWREELAAVMVGSAGPLRDGAGLRAGLEALAGWPEQAAPEEPEGITAANAGLVARLIMAAALLREESRGGHFRSDFPHSSEEWRGHTILRRGAAWDLAPAIAEQPALAHAAD